MTPLQLTVAFTAMVIFTWIWHRRQTGFACPSCGTRDGQHADHCSWRRFYE